MCNHVIFKPCFPGVNHAFSHSTSMNQVFQESQEHILKRRTWAVPEYIDADKASAPCYCVHTQRPACDPYRPGKYGGTREVMDDLFPINATSIWHVVQAPMCHRWSFEYQVWKSLRVHTLCKEPDSIRYTQSQEFTNSLWLTHGIYKKYL